MGTGSPHFAIAVVLALLLGSGAIGCGSDDEKSHDAIVANPENREVTLTVGAMSSPEQETLGEIYAQALAAAGYRVRKDFGLGPGSDARQALRSRRVSGYPATLSSTLSSLGVKLRFAPGSAGTAYKQAKSRLAARGLTAFPPTPFTSAYVLAALKEVNAEQGWENAFGLENRTEDLTAYGPPGCRQRRDCLAGLIKNYALAFKSFTAIAADLRYEVLESGQADVSFVTTTDGRLAAERDRFLSLVDTKKALPAGNVVFITTPEIVEEAGPDYEKTIVEVQKGLTVPVMQKLNARVEFGGRSPAKAAAFYLEESGYTEER
jgi:osmoprotectant transport system substrate-binding protein